MLDLIQIEFLKLRRRKFVWLMLLAAFIMPFVAAFYFKTSGAFHVTPIQFYKFSALSYTLWIILPVVLGILCTMLMFYENQNDMLKQLWIVPVSKIGYIFSKFVIVLFYSLCFMLLTAIGSVLAGVISGLIEYTNDSAAFLFLKCLQIGFLTPLAMLSVLAVAASQKGYILPVCVTIIYAFLGFIILMVDMYIHPVSSVVAIILQDVEGVVLDQPVQTAKAFLCIGIWGTASAIYAMVALKKRE